MQNTKSSPFLFWLLGVYAVLFSALAINPIDRPTWFVENLTVWIILAVIIGLYVKGVQFSKTAYGLMFILIYLHTIGGHYTFALVPFDYVTNFFGFARNHFDRIAHFSVGFYAFAVAEWLWGLPQITSSFRFHIPAIFRFFSITNPSPYLDMPQDLLNQKNEILRKSETESEEVICGSPLTKRLVANKFLLFTYPVFLIAAIAMSYELVEWIFAITAAPEAVADYLGSQGDIWDAQKDMLADTLGAIFATSIFFFSRGLWGEKKE